MRFFKTLKTFLTSIGFLPSPGIAILTYHGVVESITHERLQRNFHTKDEFESQIKYLKKKKYHFINANDLERCIEHPKEANFKKAVCITFDDGYQNNMEAIAILEKYNVPGIFFVSSASINAKISIWTVNLSLLLLEGSLERITFNKENFSLETYEERLKNFNVIRKYLKNCSSMERMEHFNQLVTQFPKGELECLIEKYDYFKMMTWDEMRKCQNENIQFHSHGHWHEIHHEFQSASILEEEILQSKRIIEKELGNDVFLFAYPNGNYNPLSFYILEKNGYKMAFILKEKKVKDMPNPYCIERITPNRKFKKFKKQLIS